VVVVVMVVVVVVVVNWYLHISKAVCEDEVIKVLWNEGVQTDREALAKRPSIIIKNKKNC
jgi:hypothetical protein